MVMLSSTPPYGFEGGRSTAASSNLTHTLKWFSALVEPSYFAVGPKTEKTVSGSV